MGKKLLSCALFSLILLTFILGCSDDYITFDYREKNLNSDDAPLIVLEAQTLINSLDFPVQTLNLNNNSFKDIKSTRSVLENSLSINWSSYILSENNNYDIAIIPIKDNSTPVFVQLTKHGRSQKSINKVVKKLIIRRSKKSGEITIVVGTYICEKNYYNDYHEELESLGNGGGL